jgi:hypothetical protein
MATAGRIFCITTAPMEITTRLLPKIIQLARLGGGTTWTAWIVVAHQIISNPWRFGASSYKAAPKGPRSSLVKHDADRTSGLHQTMPNQPLLTEPIAPLLSRNLPNFGREMARYVVSLFRLDHPHSRTLGDPARSHIRDGLRPISCSGADLGLIDQCHSAPCCMAGSAVSRMNVKAPSAG